MISMLSLWTHKFSQSGKKNISMLQMLSLFLVIFGLNEIDLVIEKISG